jgi:hypothetical protein
MAWFLQFRIKSLTHALYAGCRQPTLGRVSHGRDYFSLAYSALACMSNATLWSAVFQSVRKSS